MEAPKLSNSKEDKYGVGRALHEHCSDTHMNVNSSSFAFYKEHKKNHKSLLSLHAKSVPSKWDDAERWLVSFSPANGYTEDNRLKPIFQSQLSPHSSRNASTGGYMDEHNIVKKTASANSTDKLFSNKVISQSMVYPNEYEDDFLNLPSKSPVVHFIQCHDSHHAAIASDTKDNACNGMDFQTWPQDPRKSLNYDSGLGKGGSIRYTNKNSSSARPVSMRDRGTDMTPIASEDPSRNVTPAKVGKSIIHYTVDSSSTLGAAQAEDGTYFNKGSVSSEDEDLHKFTGQEIVLLNSQIENTKVESKEGETHDTSQSLQAMHRERMRGFWLTQTEAWEEAERSRYMAKYKQEELKIQAWENHQKAKAESEMRRIEIKAQRMKLQAQEKLLDRLASLQRKAEEKKVAAEARQTELGVKSKKRNEYFRGVRCLFRIPVCL